MKERCYAPSYRGYHNYGGRGIRICDEWRNSFEAFYAHIGPRPSSEHSLDRIDNDGNYEPGNVRWATRNEQRGNRRKATPMSSERETQHPVIAVRVKPDLYAWADEQAAIEGISRSDVARRALIRDRQRQLAEERAA
jgi:hypothetical protein